nr:hypothetical protein [Tanacetum cinerariifolium]
MIAGTASPSLAAILATVTLHTREPKRTVKQSIAKPLKKTVASESNQKPRNITKKLYEYVSKACSWWYPKFTPLGYKWKPKSQIGNINPNLVEIVLFIVDSGCSKHMTRNLKLLIKFVEKFLETVKFRNDQIAPILGYGDLGNDLLTGSHGIDLYSIILQDTSSPNPICLMAKATLSQAWLWYRRLSYLNFDTINLLSKNDIVVGLPKLKFVKDHLCSSCELRKSKRKSFQTKTTPSSKRRLQLVHMDLCGPMRVASINGKKYVLVIVDDYSRYTWTHFLRSKDETPEVLIDFLRLVQRGLHAQVRIFQTDKRTEFLNKTLHAYFASEGILHQTSVARIPKQNDVVKRRNRTLVEATRTMLSAAKIPLFFWAEAIATTCFTQNHLYSIILQDTSSPNPICLMAKATSPQAWLWYRRLSHLNFDTINLLSKNDIVVGLPKLKFIKDHLCSSCEFGKSKRKSFQTKTTPSSKRRLQLLHMDLCGPMWVASINGKKYVLVIVDDYSRYTWTHFLRSKDETPEVLIDFLRLVQRGLHAQVRIFRTDKRTKFLNKTLHAYFASEGILHQTSVARIPEQNDVVKTRNRTLVEATRTMLSAAKSRAYRVFNKRTTVIVETIHVNFDELPQMVSDHISSDPIPQCQRTALEHVSFSPGPQCQENVPQAAETVTTSNELDLLFSLMFDELLNGST